MTQFLLCGFLGSTGANIRRVWGGTAFAQRSETIKALLGLLSGRVVLRKQDGEALPRQAPVFPRLLCVQNLIKKMNKKRISYSVWAVIFVTAFYSRQNKLPNKKPPHYDAKQDRNAEAAVLSEQHKGEIMKMQ